MTGGTKTTIGIKVTGGTKTTLGSKVTGGTKTTIGIKVTEGQRRRPHVITEESSLSRCFSLLILNFN